MIRLMVSGDQIGQMDMLFNHSIRDSLVNTNFLYNSRFKALSFLILKVFKDSLLSHSLFSLSWLNLSLLIHSLLNLSLLNHSLLNLNLLNHSILNHNNSLHDSLLLNLKLILLGPTMCKT